MKSTKIAPHKSSLGMDANIASLAIFAAMVVVSWIPYVGWISWGVPLVFLYLEKQSGFVKFQAVTALVIGALRAACSIVLQIFIWILTPRNLYGALNYLTGNGWGAWVILGAISTIINVLITIITIFFIIKAYGYVQVEMPFIGPLASKVADKLNSMNFGQQSGQQPPNYQQQPPNYQQQPPNYQQQPPNYQQQPPNYQQQPPNYQQQPPNYQQQPQDYQQQPPPNYQQQPPNYQQPPQDYQQQPPPNYQQPQQDYQQQPPSDQQPPN